MSDIYIGIWLSIFNFAYFLYFRWRIGYFFKHMKSIVAPSYVGISWINYFFLGVHLFVVRESMFGYSGFGSMMLSFVPFGFAIYFGAKRSFYIGNEAKMFAEKHRTAQLQIQSGVIEYDWHDSNEVDDSEVHRKFVLPFIGLGLLFFMIKDIGRGYTFGDILLEYGELVFCIGIWVVIELFDLNRDN